MLLEFMGTNAATSATNATGVARRITGERPKELDEAWERCMEALGSGDAAKLEKVSTEVEYYHPLTKVSPARRLELRKNIQDRVESQGLKWEQRDPNTYHVYVGMPTPAPFMIGFVRQNGEWLCAGTYMSDWAGRGQCRKSREKKHEQEAENPMKATNETKGPQRMKRAAVFSTLFLSVCAVAWANMAPVGITNRLPATNKPSLNMLEQTNGPARRESAKEPAFIATGSNGARATNMNRVWAAGRITGERPKELDEAWERCMEALGSGDAAKLEKLSTEVKGFIPLTKLKREYLQSLIEREGLRWEEIDPNTYDLLGRPKPTLFAIRFVRKDGQWLCGGQAPGW
jgi:hypothetical protein